MHLNTLYFLKGLAQPITMNNENLHPIYQQMNILFFIQGYMVFSISMVKNIHNLYILQLKVSYINKDLDRKEMVSLDLILHIAMIQYIELVLKISDISPLILPFQLRQRKINHPLPTPSLHFRPFHLDLSLSTYIQYYNSNIIY